MVNRSALPAFIVVSVEDIARRAYEIYVQRGRLDGSDREDWRRAERELEAPADDADRRRSLPAETTRAAPPLPVTRAGIESSAANTRTPYAAARLSQRFQERDKIGLP